jgi:hypothetical protein
MPSYLFTAHKSMRQNRTGSSEFITEATDHDHHRNPPLVGAILPSCSSHGELLSMLDVVVLSLPSMWARSTAMPVSSHLPSHHERGEASSTLEFTRLTSRVDTRRCEERVELDVVTREADYWRSDLIGDPSVAIVIMMRIVHLREKGRWYPEVRKEKRKPMEYSVSPETRRCDACRGRSDVGAGRRRERGEEKRRGRPGPPIGLGPCLGAGLAWAGRGRERRWGARAPAILGPAETKESFFFFSFF